MSGRKMDCPAPKEIPFASLGDVNRLGAAFCADAYAPEHVAGIQSYRAFRMQCLVTTLRILDACRPPARSVISVRLKRLDSIRRKITRPDANFRLGTLDDIIGVRVICQSVTAVVALSTRIKSSPRVHRIKNYMEAPATTGYRGVHHIMRFDQPVTPETSLAVRYEIQVRTYLQHRWAVWCESHGEKAKLGKGDVARQQELRSVAWELAQWERGNPARVQAELLPYSGVQTVAVCWRPPHGPATPLLFHDDVGGAVSWLNHLETAYSAQRENALLLVGITDHEEIERALRFTHPLYIGARPVDPRLYAPFGSR